MNHIIASQASAAIHYPIQFQQMAGCIYNKRNNRKSTITERWTIAVKLSCNKSISTGQMLCYCTNVVAHFCISQVVISRLFSPSAVIVFLLGYSRVCEANQLSTGNWNSIHYTALHQVPGILVHKVNKSDQSSYYLGWMLVSWQVGIRPVGQHSSMPKVPQEFC